MPVLLLVAVYCIVHLVALYLTRASGAFSDLFGREWSLHAGDGSEILAGASGDWIDNHAFWELADELGEPDRFWDDQDGSDQDDADDVAAAPVLRAVDF